MIARKLGLVALLMLTALLACASVPQQPQGVRRQFIAAPIVENALDFLYFAIAERARLEAWFCLRGHVDRKTENAIILNISPVFVDSADGANIHGRPAECLKSADSSSIIGTVHFHPAMGSCEFSEIDLVTAHYLPYQVAAIVCRDAANPRPHLRLAFRTEIDSAFRAIKRTGEQDSLPEPRTFTPVYVYRPR